MRTAEAFACPTTVLWIGFGLNLAYRSVVARPNQQPQLLTSSDAGALTQMQDIAGCRIVVADITVQSQLIRTLENMFEVTVVDRRVKPSHGYRAVHVITHSTGLPVEIQLRTDLQHVWAELSEKLADVFGIETKYGSGPQSIRKTLDDFSTLIANFELHLDIESGQNERVRELKLKIRQTMVSIATAPRQWI